MKMLKRESYLVSLAGSQIPLTNFHTGISVPDTSDDESNPGMSISYECRYLLLNAIEAIMPSPKRFQRDSIDTSPEQESSPSTPQTTVDRKGKQRAIEGSPTQRLSSPEPSESIICFVILALDDAIYS